MEAPLEQGPWAEARSLYRASQKPSDIVWNTYAARPLAAAALVALRRTSVTPNQLSFLGLALFMLVPAAMIALHGPWGFLAAALAVQLSYVLDCADGQLARLKGMVSDVGAHLDFLIDEVKALLLVAGCSVRLWQTYWDTTWLLVGVATVVVVASATSLTTFIRRPEYAGREVMPGTDVGGPAMPSGLAARAVWLVMRAMRLVVHYPSWILPIALLGLIPGLDGARVFFTLYASVLSVYLGRTGLLVLMRLAHPRFYDRPAD